jgi:phosphoglucosamine mutase
VGDRYIIEQMKNSGAILGGEPSGHVIFKNQSTTGDGAVGALKVIEAMKFYNKSVRELVLDINLFPQITKSIVVQVRPPLDSIQVIQDKLVKTKKELGKNGRVLLRYSGTEPLIRIMVEGEKFEVIDGLCDQLIKVVSKELS